MHRHHGTAPEYIRHASAMAEAIEKQQAASKSAQLWQSLLERSNDKYIRLYFQGQVDLSRFREFHCNLVARSCQEAGHGRILHSPANGLQLPAPPCGYDSQINWDARDSKAAAFSLLAECSWRLGMEKIAESYETRARLEDATSRVRAKYEKKSEQEIKPDAGARSADLTRSYHHLESAARSLGEYNVAYAKVMAHMRGAGEFETAIQRLESAADHRSLNATETARFDKARQQRDIAARLAEKEALAAIAAYRSYQAEMRLASREYEAINRDLAGNEPERTQTTSEALQQTKEDLLAPGHRDPETEATETPVNELDECESERHPETKEQTQAVVANAPMRKLAAGVVVSQILRELDRGI